MPREQRANIPLHRDLNRVDRREPTLRRHLPQQVFTQLERERAQGTPHRYTTREVQAIVNFVSQQPQPGRALPNIDYNAIHQNNRAARRSQAEFAAQRDREQQQRQLASSSKPTLAARITEPTHTPIAPKPVHIDFAKHTTQDLIGIYLPKFQAVLKRFKPFDELEQFLDAPIDDQRAINRLRDRITELHQNLDANASVTTHQEWQRWEYGLKSIGEVSFKNLRANFRKVLKELVAIERFGYFN